MGTRDSVHTSYISVLVKKFLNPETIIVSPVQLEWRITAPKSSTTTSARLRKRVPNINRFEKTSRLFLVQRSTQHYGDRGPWNWSLPCTKGRRKVSRYAKCALLFCEERFKLGECKRWRSLYKGSCNLYLFSRDTNHRSIQSSCVPPCERTKLRLSDCVPIVVHERSTQAAFWTNHRKGKVVNYSHDCL